MLNLLGSDLKRIFKDKIFIVICVLGALFAIVIPLIYFIIFAVIDRFAAGGFDYASLGFGFSGKEMFFNFFNPGNNFGIILPVLVIVIILKDFSYGTIRNKLICGYSRTQIYFSYLISTFIVIVSVILTFALITLGLTTLLTIKNLNPLTLNNFLYFLVSTLFMILGYMFITSLVVFIGSLIKNIPLTIIIQVALTMGFTMVSTFLQLGVGLLMFSDNEILINISKVLNVIDNCNIYGAITSVIGKISEYKLENILYLTIIPIICSGLLTLFGVLIFKKRDI